MSHELNNMKNLHIELVEVAAAAAGEVVVAVAVVKAVMGDYLGMEQ